MGFGNSGVEGMGYAFRCMYMIEIERFFFSTDPRCFLQAMHPFSQR